MEMPSMGNMNFEVSSLFTEVTDGLPVILMDREPLTVSRADVDVHRAEVIVLLVTCWVNGIKVVFNFSELTQFKINIPTLLSPNKKNKTKRTHRHKRVSAFFTWCSAPWNLHVELHSVHAKDSVSDVAQHVSTWCYTHKCWQLLQFLKLGLPPERAKHVRGLLTVAFWLKMFCIVRESVSSAGRLVK